MARGKVKFGINFDGFLDYAREIDEKYGEEALKEATGSALRATKDYLNAEIVKAMNESPYNFDRTGRTREAHAKKTRVHRTVTWNGTVATIYVGFEFPEGLPARYLSSGTIVHGSPHVKPDMNLRHAMMGTGKHEEVIAEIQQNEFAEVLLKHSGYYDM
jgi:hypothetical protein